MPYTDHKAFQEKPKLFSSAKSMYYYTDDGKKLLDGTTGLWCVSAGHQRSKIIHAVQDQVAKMAYCLTFHLGHVPAFKLAERITKLVPESLNHMFFSNSGSEAVDSALKIALAYQKLRNKGNGDF